MLRSRNRRRVCLASLLAPTFACEAGALGGRLRFGTTPVFLDDQIALLGAWQRHLEETLRLPVQFIQRSSYREILDGLLDDTIDVAWVCGFPYVVNEHRLALVAVPVYQGAPQYRSYLIVPAADEKTKHVSELGGRVFAYSDPLSNSGYLVPRVELIRKRQSPDSFFRRSFFTLAHRKVVQAVQTGVAQGGSVDGYIWDTLALQQPRLTRGVRVAWQSPRYGFPPIVGRKSFGTAGLASVTDGLVRMKETPAGTELLQRLNLDGFTPGTTALFDGIRDLLRVSSGVPA